jgi:eukaryotic-like serine/threonine-protein kinase
MIVTLSVIDGPHRGQVYEFSEHDTFIVGRSKDAHFRLPLKDKTLSRFHFMIEVNPPCCRLMDMASRNGTLVNGRKVTVIDLKDGDKIEGGRTTLAVTIKPEVDGLTSGPEITETRPAVPSAPVSGPATTVDFPGPGWSIPGYRVEQVLGEGGMGIVYRARRESDGAQVALKTISPAVAGSEGTIARFMREASVLRQLDHPNIVRFEKLGHSNGRLFFAMEFVPGLDAGDFLKKRGKPLGVGLAAGLACQALDALAYAHELGFVHRDIKPRNVLVARRDNRPKVKLTDFGLARIYLTSPLSGLTVTGHIAGTSGFMAPEQITDFRKVRPAADQYSTGALLYFLLTGRKVYDFPPEIQNQLLMILQEKPIPVRDRRDDVPAALAAVIDRALARAPEDRFADVRAMREALEPFASPSAL